MKRFLVISGITILCLSILFALGSAVYGATSVSGFNETLSALMSGLTEYFRAVIEAFGMILK